MTSIGAPGVAHSPLASPQGDESARPEPAACPPPAPQPISRPPQKPHLLDGLLHPVRTQRDADIQACLRSKDGTFHQAAAKAWGQLSKQQRRAEAAWLAPFVRCGAVRSWEAGEVLVALFKIPHALRRPLWTLCLDRPTREAEPEATFLRPDLLGRLARLPPAQQAALAAWEPEVIAGSAPWPKLWSWLSQCSDFHALLPHALRDPEAFGRIAQVTDSLSFLRGGNLPRIVQQHLVGPPAAAPEAVEGVLQHLAQHRYLDRGDDLKPFLEHMRQATPEVRAALQALGAGPWGAVCIEWIIELPTAFRDPVQRMLTGCPNLGHGGLQRFAPERKIMLLAAAGLQGEAAQRAEVAAWLKRPDTLGVGHFLRAAEALAAEGADFDAISCYLRAGRTQEYLDHIDLRDHLTRLARCPGWTWTAAARALAPLKRKLCQNLVAHASEGPLPEATLAQIARLSAAAWSIAKQFPEALHDAAWLDALAALPPYILATLQSSRAPEAHLEAALEGVPSAVRRGVRAQLRRLQQEGHALPSLCLRAAALSVEAEVEALQAGLGGLPADLQRRAAERLRQLPSDERSTWAAELLAAAEPDEMIDVLAIMTTPEERRTFLVAAEVLDDTTPRSRAAVQHLLLGLEPAQAAAFTTHLRGLREALRRDPVMACELIRLLAYARLGGRLAPVLHLVRALHWLAPVLRGWPPEKLWGLAYWALSSPDVAQSPGLVAAQRLVKADPKKPGLALRQALVWLFTTPVEALPPRAQAAADPWERDHVLTQRRRAQQRRPPMGAEDAATLYEAMQHGDWALALLLAEHTQPPPHVLYFLHLNRQDGRAAADALFADETEATCAAAHAWGGSGPLPMTVRLAWRERFGPPITATVVQELTAACDLLGLPAALDAPFRIAMLTAVLDPADPVGAHTDARPFTCVVCDQAVTEHVHLAGCACDPSLCDGCAAQAVTQRGDRLTCPTACPAPLNREYLERIGVAPPVAQQRLTASLRARLGRIPELVLSQDRLAGHQEGPRAVGPDAIPAIRPGQDRTTLRLLLSGLAPWANHNGDGVYRECYTCAQPVQKGDACMHMHCDGNPRHEWDFERGPYDGHPRYGAGIAAQGYIPCVPGPLGRAGFYDGLPTGLLNADTRRCVTARRAAWLRQLGGEVAPMEEAAVRRTGNLPRGGGFEEAL